MNKLGVQSQIVTDAYRTMVRASWPAVLKAIVPGGLDADLLREWRARRPDGLLILRHYFPDESLDPAKFAAVVGVAQSIADLRPILEVPVNESSQTSPDAIAALAAYSARFVVAATVAGFRAAVGVFSEGNPSDLGWWPAFYPALRAARAAGGYLALHEYGVPALGFEDWHLLRHRRVWPLLPEDCRVPILVTECGIDGGIAGRREVGWRGYMDAAAYAVWLRRYRQEVAADAYVHGATLFLCGGLDQWRLFDLADEVDLRPVFTEPVGGPALWAPPEPPPVPPEPSPLPPKPTPLPPKPNPGGVPVPDVALSVPERHSHAIDGNYEPTGFGPCVGVVVHSTAGVSATIENDYIGTINWFQDQNAQVSAQRVIGAGKFAEVNTSVHDGEKAYHAREPANSNRRGIEFAHPDTDAWNAQPYPDFQYEAAGELIARWKVADDARGWRWPIKLLTRAELAANPSAPGICYHRDLPAGIADGRRDPTGPFDGVRLIAAATRWYAKLTGPTPIPTPAPPTPGPEPHPIPPEPGHWPNGRVIASNAEYEAHCWALVYAAAQALRRGGNGSLGDDADALALEQILTRSKRAHGAQP